MATAAHTIFRTVGLSFGVAVMGRNRHRTVARRLAEADIDPAGFTAGISAGFAVNAGLALAAAAFAVVIRTHTGTARNGPRQRPCPLDAAGLNPDASGRDLHIYPPGPPVIGSATGSSSGPNAARAVAHRRATLPPREVVEAA